MENYLMLNGQRIELTDSQYKEIMNAIGDSAPTKENPFARRVGENFYTVESNGKVYTDTDFGIKEDDLCYESANYCSDKDLLTRRAFYEKVERNLWRFSMENGGSGKYYIYFNELRHWWDWSCWDTNKVFGPTFVSKEVALRAINEVLIPLTRKEDMDALDLLE